MNKIDSEMISRIPEHPGVYLMKDANNAVIYVGKASNLKKRLSTYFENQQHKDAKTAVLVEKIASFETIVTHTEQEAFVLEASLIQQYKPRYNVILKDDKKYPSLRIDLEKPYPIIQWVRKIKADGALYFGPYASATALRDTLKFIHKNFKLRKCKSPDVKPRKRPCLNYQMNVCYAPCCFEVSHSQYAEIVHEVRMFLEGRPQALIRKVRTEMMAAAEKQDFEKAAQLRDRMYSLEKIIEKQLVVSSDFSNRDVIGLARNSKYVLIAVLKIREGRVQGIHPYSLNDDLSSDGEIIGAFLRHFYRPLSDMPDEILVPCPMEEMIYYQQWLRELSRRTIHLIFPRRGDKAKLLEMAFKNAEGRLMELMAGQTALDDVLIDVQQTLKLIRYPNRIECFDNSGFAGKHLVAGRAVYISGRPAKAEYRHYALQSVSTQDDYACMAEVLTRRFESQDSFQNYPDLIIIDGGKGQLHVAVSILKKFGLYPRIDVISIAKSTSHHGGTDDKIFKPDRVNPLNLRGKKEVLLFLQQIRDEAHRFAIAYHRKKRKKKFYQSVLDDIPGIGRKRKIMLLNRFGSIQEIQNASMDELIRIPGINRRIAQSIHNAFQNKG